MDSKVVKKHSDRRLHSQVIASGLDSLYEVSKVLSRSLDFRETLTEVLNVLDDTGNMSHGMISLIDEVSGDLMVIALHKNPFP